MRSLSSFKRKSSIRIAYGEKGTMTFEEIFKKHPLESLQNEKHFKNIDLITQRYGAKKDVIVLNPNYALKLLKKIAKNDVNDVGNFYELAKLTVLNFTKKKLTDPNRWFKKVLTMFWLSVPECHNKMNYWSELNTDEKDDILKMALEFYGVSAYKNIEKKNLGIENINEKMIYLFLHSNIHFIDLIDIKLNKIEEVIDYNSNQGNIINHDILSEMIDPLIINPYIINVCLNYSSNLDLEKVNILVSKMRESKVLIFDTDKKVIPLKDFYELVNIQSWLIKKKNSFYKDKDEIEDIKDFSFTPYRTCLDILKTYDKNNIFINKSLIKFINSNSLSCNENSKKEELDMWAFAALEISLPLKEVKQKSNKI